MTGLESKLLKNAMGWYLGLILTVFSISLWAGPVEAAAKKKVDPKPHVARKIQPHLGTSFRFDGMSLHGKYQSAPWTSTTVEDDKFLEDLLGARKHFRDRVEMDQKRN